MAKLLNIFEFSDYRGFISAWIEVARIERRSNLTKLAAKIGVHTTFLSHVLSGTKNLSAEQATEVSFEFELTKIEEDYFYALIGLDRAGSPRLRKYWQTRVESIRSESLKLNSRVVKHKKLSSEERAIFYSSWIYVAIFVATAINDGQTLEQIAERFQLSRERAGSYLGFLVRSGICKVDNGVYRMGESSIYIPNESALVVRHHSNWRLRGMHRMDHREETELFYTAPMSMSHQDFLRIRELLVEVVQKSLVICKDSPAENVYCLNIDFFRSER